jgi:hypothetical protein
MVLLAVLVPMFVAIVCQLYWEIDQLAHYSTGGSLSLTLNQESSYNDK